MKNKIVTLCLVLVSTFAMAGGDMAPSEAKSLDITAKVCKQNRVYVERATQLMWQDQAYTDTEDGAFKHEKSREKAGNHRYAEQYCSRLNYAGYADWRLPTSDELAHIHDEKEQVFAYFRDGDFWTSTPSIQSKYYVIYPADAMQYARNQRQSNYIRCVRCLAE